MLRWAKCSLTAGTHTWYSSQLLISLYAQIYLILDRRYQVNTASIFVWDFSILSTYRIMRSDFDCMLPQTKERICLT